MTVLDDTDWSHKAWMSKRDADLFEHVLLRQAEARPLLRVLEWGAGKSTRYFTNLLSQRGVLFHWVSLEYDRVFFEEDVAPHLPLLPAARVSRIERGGLIPEPQMLLRSRFPAVDFVLFDYGRLRPFLPEGGADRTVSMDDYVGLPATLGVAFDLVLVDGRKRRRCLLEAARVISDEGVAVLHDAQRPYYHCAFGAFPAHQSLGDILWVGARYGATLERVLSHAEAVQ
ncbi:MAG: hypothetical protein M5U28_40910 [Sandaracinaceae bacterium]|nr:hypothetical protein [Sandaracinaceae bacterium]